MAGIDIMLSVRENASDQFISMHSSNKALQKGLQETEAELENMEKKQASLRKEMAKMTVTMEDVNQTFREAKKAYRENADEINRTNLEHAAEQYENVREKMRSLQKESRSTQNAMAELNVTRSKLENRAGGLSFNLDKAGFSKLFGDMAAKGLATGITSAYGQEAGTLFSGILSGASNGAAMGAVVGHPVVGGLVGAASGAVDSAFGLFSSKDEAFKQVVQQQYSDALAVQEISLTSGSSSAAAREKDKLAFSSLLGSEETAGEYLDWVKRTANSTPFQYDDLTKMSKTLATYKYTPEEMQDLLLKIGDTGANLGLDASGMSTVATYLGRMKSTNKTALEYINPLIERGIPAMEYLADSLKVSEEYAYNMVSKGLIPGADAARIIADAMGEANQGAMELQANTFEGLTSTLDGWELEMDSAMGLGYNNTLKPALAEQNAWYAGEYGEEMLQANQMIGISHGQLEVERQRIWREEMEKVFQSDEYKKAREEENGFEAERLLSDAESNAETLFKGSPIYKAYRKSQDGLVGDIQENNIKNSSWIEDGQTERKLDLGVLSYFLQEENKRLANGGAQGADGFYNVGTIQINLPGEIHIREEADIDKVANRIVENMLQAFQLGTEMPLP